MNEPFKVGERAVLQNLEHFPEYEGQECTVTQPLMPRRCLNTSTMKEEARLSYVVRVVADNMKLNVTPFQLRPKLKPPVKQKEEVLES